MEHVTPSGLVVAEQRHHRADDPRSWPPNDNIQPPPPVGTGPTTSEGYGNTHVMYPESLGAPPVQAWSGWPVEWSTPNWGDAAGGLAGMINRVSTVFGAIDLNSSILATMPPYRLRGTDVIEPTGWMVNPQPEVYSGWTEAMKQLIVSYMNGEAFVWATSRHGDGSVRTWVMLNPAWVEVEMRGQVRRFLMGGVDITDDVLHLRYTSWPGDAHGHGPLEALAQNLFGAASLERYQAGLSTRGGIPWGVLTAPGNLSEEQATLLRNRFVAARMSSMGAPAVMSGGVELTPFTISPRDMALLELRQFDEARIATLLGVPPTLLGLPTGDGSLVYQNVSSIYDFHWRAYLRPKAAMIMEAFSQWAMPEGERVELNRDEYVRPAFPERVTAWAALFGIHDEATGQRAVTIDEIRAAERLNANSVQASAAVR
jgi:HK97 family phage portal protein